MKKCYILLIILSMIFIVSCKSYSPEVQSKLEECKKIVGWGGCQMDLAIKQNDESICNSIKNRHYEEVCKISVARDFKKCDEIKNWDFSEREVKYDEDVKKMMQSQIKAMLTPSKSTTEFSCYSNAAEITKDDSYCLKIESDIYKKECLKSFPEKWTEVKLCDIGYGTDTWGIQNCKDYALNKEAFKTVNPKLCLDISDKAIRTQCINNIARKTGNMKLCQDYKEFVYDHCESSLYMTSKLD